jgi:hypothetical protein
MEYWDPRSVVQFGGARFPPARTEPLRRGEGPASRWSGNSFGLPLERTLAPPTFWLKCTATQRLDQLLSCFPSPILLTIRPFFGAKNVECNNTVALQAFLQRKI